MSQLIDADCQQPAGPAPGPGTLEGIWRERKAKWVWIVTCITPWVQKGMAFNTETAATVVQLLQDAGIQLSMGEEQTLISLHPDGAIWLVSANGPTKLTYSHKLANER